MKVGYRPTLGDGMDGQEFGVSLLFITTRAVVRDIGLRQQEAQLLLGDRATRKHAKDS